MKTEHTWRFLLVGAVILVLPMLIVVRIIELQTNPQQVTAIRKLGKVYGGEWRTIRPARGEIYDRWGHLLAGNKLVYEVGVDLNSVKNPETIAATLNMVLGSDYSTILALASIKPSSTAVYSKLTDFVSPEKVEQIKQFEKQMEISYGPGGGKDHISLEGLLFSAHLARTYPEKTLGANLLGFVNGEGKGFYGVEGKYNEMLAGKEKTVYVSFDPNLAATLPDVPDGVSLVLTIDREIQATMEEIIDNAVAENGADSGTIVVMDPRTGEVLALATTPRLDLNEYWNYGDVYPGTTPFNRGVSQSYEPGSVFKVLTMAAALDSKAVQVGTTFLDTGVFEIGGTFIYNWNSGAWGNQDMQGCMQHSLNVCLAWIASQMGPKTFYQYMQAFGIGRLSGVDLAGEAAGRLKIPGDGDWYDADLGTNAFGQGVSATPLQMAAAISAVANDGRMMAPHVVRSMINKGYQHDMEVPTAGIPLRPETARDLTEMLARSLEVESSDALVPGYRVAGKTGTAEIPTPFGYTSNQTNASFVGWGPADDPRFLVYVWLEKPSTSQWGSVVAAPIFSEAVQKLVTLMKLPPDDIRKQLYGQ